MSREFETRLLSEDNLDLEATIHEANSTLMKGFGLFAIGVAGAGSAITFVNKIPDDVTYIETIASALTITAGLIVIDQGERMKNTAIQKAQSLGMSVKNNLFRGRVNPS